MEKDGYLIWKNDMFIVESIIDSKIRCFSTTKTIKLWNWVSVTSFGYPSWKCDITYMLETC